MIQRIEFTKFDNGTIQGNTYDSNGDYVFMPLTEAEATTLDGFFAKGLLLRPAHEQQLAAAESLIQATEEARIQAEEAKLQAEQEKTTAEAEKSQAIAEAAEAKELITNLTSVADFTKMTEEELIAITPFVKEWEQGAYNVGAVRRDGNKLYRVVVKVPATELKRPSEVATSWELITAGSIKPEKWNKGTEYIIGALVWHPTEDKVWQSKKDRNATEPAATNDTWELIS